MKFYVNHLLAWEFSASRLIILTLYALMDPSFWFEAINLGESPLYILSGHRLQTRVHRQPIIGLYLEFETTKFLLPRGLV